MKDKEWIDAFKQEMNEIHVPDRLKELTKQKVAEENVKYKREKDRRKKISYRIGGLTVAAAILVLFIILLPFVNSYRDFKHQEGTKILLGSNQEKEFYLNEKVEIERTSVLPVEFIKNTVSEEQIENTKVLHCSTDDGYYITAFEDEDAYVIIRSKEKDKDKVRNIIIYILENRGDSHENR